ncbi:replication initiator protein A [Oenococcus oeni]|uniref:aldose epimerase family protein n=1 Tax=Oenococcus oeni TaxID=1247 RepID=UPI00067D554C|nr:replication initiator protein A [Oenococcus oeni]
MKKQKKETPNEHFEFYEKDNVYGALFFQFPKVLLYGEKYKRLSSDAKLAYMVLKDRLEYSLRNNWIDEDNHVYFIFTNQELVNLFNCSEHKVIKVKTELESLGLLFQKQMGFNPKTKKNEPNRLYLSKLDVEATDVYLREKSQDSSLTPATSGTEKSAVPRKNAETPATSGTEKSAVPHKSVENNGQSIATSGSSKNGLNLYKEPKEKDKYRYNIDTLTENNQVIVSFLGRQSKADGVFNPTLHAYFNLGQSDDILDHSLLINSQKHLQLNAAKIPTGRLVDNQGPFDLAQHPNLKAPLARLKKTSKEQGFDDVFVINCPHTGPIARLKDLNSNYELTITSDRNVLVVYTANQMASNLHLNHSAKPWSAVALEAQTLPNSENLTSLGNVTLLKDSYRKESISYQFLRG